MAGDIGCDFTAAGRMADVDRAAQVEMFGNRCGIGGIMRHIVTVADL